LLDQVGEGCTASMRRVLTHVCREFDMIYLGYSGCDSFSVQPVLRDVATDHTTLWLWYDESREKVVLDTSSRFYEDEQKRVGEMVFEGKSFAEIPRGMETLSTCEILSGRQCAFRFRGNITRIMHAVVPENTTIIPESCVKGPIPSWIDDLSLVDAMRCAARLYSISGRLDQSIALIEEAKVHTDTAIESRQKGLILKELGTQYAHAGTSSNYEKALLHLEASKAIFNNCGDYENLLCAQLDIVDVLHHMRHFDEAEQILQILQDVFELRDDDTFALKAKVRKGLLKGLILGIGRKDKFSNEASIPILEETAQLAAESGFVRLHAAVLNTSGLVKYQSAGDSVEHLLSVVRDIDTALRLNIYIGDARSCFQQLRILGLVHMELFHLQNKPELLEQAIQNFQRGEKFLFRLTHSRIVIELLEVRFRLGGALNLAGRAEEAEPILLYVQEEQFRLGDWYNEARTLELLLKTTKKTNDLIERCERVKVIYEDARTNEAKKKRFQLQPITLTNGRSILLTAANLVKGKNQQLATELQLLQEDLFSD